MNRNISLIVVFVSLVLSGCCTKKECLCPEVKIEVQATVDIGYYSIIRTDKSYHRMDSAQMYFTDGTPVYFLDQNSFVFKQGESIKDFNFIIKNSKTNVCDTLSGISYNLKSYSFECNDCIFKNDMMHCDNIVDKELLFRGQTINDFKVKLN